MEYLISDLMKDYIDNECYPASFESPEVSTERIRQMTMKKIGAGKSVGRPCRLGRTLLIAAVCTVLLIGGALAVRQIAFKDVLVGEPYGAENVQGEAAIDPWERIDISVNGTTDSPEYRACAEWKAWNEAWWAENPNPWAERGVDDTYFETEGNYAWIYDAWFAEQADKLDEIAEKYGLTLHTISAPIRTEEELCSLLGLNDLWQGEFSTDHGTVFENGSFALNTALEENMYAYVDVNADGSFSTLCMSIIPKYEEWSYVTADGTAVTLAMADISAYPDIVGSPINGFLVTRFDEAAVTVSFTGAETQSELEAAADRLNLVGLSALFVSDSDRSDIPAAVKKYKETYQAETAQERAELEQAELKQQAELEKYCAQHSDEEWDALITAELGDYELRKTLPGQYEVQRVIINTPSSKAASCYPEETSNEQGVLFYYTEDGCADPAYVFRYARQWTDESHTESVTHEHFEAEVSASGSGAWELVYIGKQAVYVSADSAAGPVVEWYDEARDLRFTVADMHIINDPDAFSAAQLLGLAESFIKGLDG